MKPSEGNLNAVFMLNNLECKAYLLPPLWLCSPYLQILLNTSISAASPCPLTISTHNTSSPNHHTFILWTVTTDTSKWLSLLLGRNVKPVSFELGVVKSCLTTSETDKWTTTRLNLRWEIRRQKEKSFFLNLTQSTHLALTLITYPLSNLYH